MADLTAQLRTLWMQRTFAGPSEKFDHEVEFDAWLASVKAEAWDEGYATDPTGSWDGQTSEDHPDAPSNPYRKEAT